ncbi:MAG: hypothetical protein KAT68_05675 [Bacteroidales bacterium]|nr:hypothetical protein [Bacteroidales bacterium]
MRKNIVVFIFTFLFFSQSYSQCNDELVELCRKNIGEATYLKTFRIMLKKQKKGKPMPIARFVVKLNKGSIYLFNVSNDIANKTPAIIRLSDDCKIYGESFDSEKKLNYGGFEFYCKKTQTYYISAFFLNGNKGCAVAMLSLVGIYDTNEFY